MRPLPRYCRRKGRQKRRRDVFILIAICIVALNLNLGFLHGLVSRNTTTSSISSGMSSQFDKHLQGFRRKPNDKNKQAQHPISRSPASNDIRKAEETVISDVKSTAIKKQQLPLPTSEKSSKTIDEIEPKKEHQEDEKAEKKASSAATTRSNSTSTLQDNLSACLLIKDDNDILNEWLAYHYFALDLRYLVVAVDPSSATSPSEILNRWRNLTDLKVTEWSDTDFMPESFLKDGYHIHPKYISGDANASKWHEGHEPPEQVIRDTMRINNHRFRQVTFLSSCLRHMRDTANKVGSSSSTTFTMHVDTDEFVVVNPLLRHTKQANVQALRIHSIQEQSSVMNLIRQIHASPLFRSKANYPCISMPRLLFGSVEYNDDTSNSSTTSTAQKSARFAVPGYNTTLFETLRWKYHTDYNDTERNAQPKVIVDVSNVPPDDQMFDEPFSIHRPSKQLCRRVAQLNFTQLQRFPITVNHYTGSWTRYFLTKNDTRRSERAYQSKAHVAAGFDDWLTPWLRGFVDMMGDDTARLLLKDYHDYDDTAATTTTTKDATND